MKHEQLKLGEVLRFWFEELSHEQWFAGSEALDAAIKERFTDIHAAVAAGEFWRQRSEPQSILAEVIVLDQFSRQLFRGEAGAFAYDGIALTLAQQVVVAGYDTALEQSERLFLYMPFMHSESAVIHEDALKLYEVLGNEEALKYEKIHKDIIDRFGRYPHRNQQLGRASTAAEREYLDSTEEAFFSS